jgi:CBS domain-containing protein
MKIISRQTEQTVSKVNLLTSKRTRMDKIDLPVLKAETPLKDALNAMKRFNRAGVVVSDGDRHYLLAAGWIVIGIATRQKSLADVRRKWAIHEVPASQTDALKAMTLNSPTGVERLLDHAGRSYMLASWEPAAPKMVMIVTRHEGLARKLTESGPSVCYCTNPHLPDDPHGYSPPLPPGHKCTFDGSDIVCV